MGSTGMCCAVLAVGLVFLSLCSTGWTLECYVCSPWTTSQCLTTQRCTGADNSCMKIILPDGSRRYGCRDYNTCNTDKIMAEIRTENLEVRCCQTNLCNGSFVASPSTVLILSLAAALLLLLS